MNANVALALNDHTARVILNAFEENSYAASAFPPLQVRLLAQAVPRIAFTAVVRDSYDDGWGSKGTAMQLA